MRSYVAKPGNEDAEGSLAWYYFGVVAKWLLAISAPLAYCGFFLSEFFSDRLTSDAAVLGRALILLLLAGVGFVFVVVQVGEMVMEKLLIVDELKNGTIVLLDKEVKELATLHKLTPDQKFELQTSRNHAAQRAQTMWLLSQKP